MMDSDLKPQDNGEVWADIRDLYAYLERVKTRLTLGVYNEERDGDLLTVLEEIERILR